MSSGAKWFPFLSLLLLAAVLSGCNKNCKTCTKIEGYVYTDGRNKGVPNVEVNMTWTYKQNFGADYTKEMGTAVTDASGYFSMEYKLTKKQVDKGGFDFTFTAKDTTGFIMNKAYVSDRNFLPGEVYDFKIDFPKRAYLQVNVQNAHEIPDGPDFYSIIKLEQDQTLYFEYVGWKDRPNPQVFTVPANYTFQLETWRNKNGIRDTLIENFYIEKGQTGTTSLSY